MATTATPVLVELVLLLSQEGEWAGTTWADRWCTAGQAHRST